MTTPNAPVCYVLAQAQFSPVHNIVDYVGKIQDSLRHIYPLFDPQLVNHLQVQVSPMQPVGDVQVAQAQSWLITRTDRSAGFILSSSSITYHTTHHKGHETLIEELLRGLQAVHAAAKLDHVGRLGLRYLNAVVPSNEESVEQYLASGLLGVQLPGREQYFGTELVLHTETNPLVTQGLLIARTHRVVTPLGYPADMVPNGLVPMPKFAITEPTAHAMMDIDHSVSGIMPLELNQLNLQLLSLHESIKETFQASITPHARTVWGLIP